MSEERSDSVGVRVGVYAGTAVVALFLLLPYAKSAFVLALLIGPLAGILALGAPGRRLDHKNAAKLGFYCSFYGMIAAVAIHRVLSRVAQDELLRFENLYKLPPLLADMGLDTESAEDWYLWMFKVTVIAIFAGAIGAPLGILASRIVRRDEDRDPTEVS